MYVVLKVFLGV